MDNTPIQLSLFARSEVSTQRDDEKPDVYKGIYAMHKYWSKKPSNLVANYIKSYSKPGDIILDPFCGSGVAAIESVRLNRRAIGIDINPVAVLSTKMGLKPIDITSLKKEFAALKRQVVEKIDKLYYTDCPCCENKSAITTHTIWNNDTPIEIWAECKNCQTRKTIKVPSTQDKDSPIKPSVEPLWYPATELIENYRINAKQGIRVCDLFTPRALSALSILLAEIRQIEEKEIRTVLEFCFSAALPQASNMVFVIRRRGKRNGQEAKSKAEVGSWVIGYWVPTEHFEIHVWRCFENRFRRVLKGKEEVNQVIPVATSECISFEKLNLTKFGYLINQGTATNLDLPANSVDYIFTDPPHGNRVPYLELSLMWNSWLGLDSDWQNELVISEAKSRQKDRGDYQERLELSFAQMWRVLKEGKYISIAFNSLDDETWLSLLNSILAVGFEIVEVKPLEYSARSVVQDNRKNALKTDYVITCRKHTGAKNPEITFNSSKTQLEELIRRYLETEKQGVETYEVLNYVLIKTISTGKIFKISQILDSIKELDSFKVD